MKLNRNTIKRDDFSRFPPWCYVTSCIRLCKITMEQAIVPNDPRMLFQPLFGWTYEPLESVDPHPPWTMGRDPYKRKYLLHASDFNQHPQWAKCKDKCQWGDPLHAEDITEVYDDRVWICRTFCAYVNFRLKGNPLLLVSNSNGSPEHALHEFMKFDSDRAEVWYHTIKCLHYCLVTISDQERQAIFQLLLNTHLWCMQERQCCYRPEFALITSFQNSFLWAVPYRDIYSQVKHGLSELEELYDSVSVRDFMPIFFGNNNRRKKGIAEVEIGKSSLNKIENSCVYAWDISGDVKESDSCSCADMQENVYITHSNISFENLDLNKRLYSELGVLLGRDKSRSVRLDAP